MSTRTTIPAGKATPGTSYQTPRDTVITVIGPVEGSTDVKVKNEHGREFTLIDSYPLAPLEADGSIALEVGADLGLVGVAVAKMTLEQLDGLEDSDPRPGVLALTEARRQELEAPEVKHTTTKPAATADLVGKVWWPELVALKDDLTLRQLSTKFGVSASRINKALKRAGLSRLVLPPATCHQCRQKAPVMGCGSMAAHNDAKGSYCPASGTEAKAADVPKIAVIEEPAHVLALLTAEVQTPSQIHALTACHLTSVDKVSRALSVLVSSGKAERVGHGKYALTSGAEAKALEAMPPAGEPTPEPTPETLDPWRHLVDAKTTAERVEAIRRIQLISHLDELEGIREELQAKAARELARHRKALDAVALAAGETAEGETEAQKEGRVTWLKRYADRQDYQKRPGVMAAIRAAFADLAGQGIQVDHGIEPIKPGELDQGPDELTAADAEGRPAIPWLLAYTRRDAVAASLVGMIETLTWTVRGSRDALQGVEDPGTVALAWHFEQAQAEPRPTILEQLEARHTALGGPELARIDPGQIDVFATPEAQARQIIESAGDAMPAAFMAGRRGLDCPEDASAVDRALWLMGGDELEGMIKTGVVRRTAESEPLTDPKRITQEPETDPKRITQEPETDPKPITQAPKPPAWDLASLPLPEQVAKSTEARALELVADVTAPGLVFEIMVAEQAGKNRPAVMSALDAARVSCLDAAGRFPDHSEYQAPMLDPEATKALPQELEPAPKPAATRVEAKAPRPAPQAAQIRDLQIVTLPDGRQELWASPADSRPVRVGDCADPDLAPTLAALKSYQVAEMNAKARQRELLARERLAPTWKAAPTPLVPDQVLQVAQAGLAALAAALPALAAMGVDVEIKISTKARTLPKDLALAAS